MFEATYFTMVVGAAKRDCRMTVMCTKLVQASSHHREGPAQLDMWISTATDSRSLDLWIHRYIDPQGA